MNDDTWQRNAYAFPLFVFYSRQFLQPLTVERATVCWTSRFFYAFTYTNTNPTVTVVLDRRHLRNNGYIPQRIFADKVKGTCCRTWRGVYCREGSKRNARPCCKRVSTSWSLLIKMRIQVAIKQKNRE